jgi:hypothetical protein
MEIFVRGGKPALPGNINSHNELYPRTAVAIDRRGKKMWLVVIDGRQPDYSEGVTMSELTDIVMELGAHTALNLDGGGSTALVAAGFWGAHSLNAPIHTRIPMRQPPGLLCATGFLRASGFWTGGCKDFRLNLKSQI